MRKLFSIVAIATALICSLAFANRPSEAAHTKATLASVPTIEAGKLPGFDVGNMDTSVSACANFFQYANGGWIAKNQIPAAFSRWGRFEVLDEQNIAVLHGILDGLLAKKSLKAGSNEQKIADYYRSCMDEPGIEAPGRAAAFSPNLIALPAINDVAGLQAEIARFHAYRIPAVFGFGGSTGFQKLDKR